MKKNRAVYIHSMTRDYLEEEYISLFSSMKAELRKGSLESLLGFIESGDVFQLDTETNVTEMYTERVLHVIQLGSQDGTEQHIFDWGDIPIYAEEPLCKMFGGTSTFIAHNAKFEYIILYKYFGVSIKNFRDTMLASRLITAGLDLPKGYNGLANLVKMMTGVDLSKASQTSFTGGKMSPEQLLYANTDVLYLDSLWTTLMRPINKWDLGTVLKLECKALRPIGDMTINGVRIDTTILEENILSYDTGLEESLANMIKVLRDEVDPKARANIAALNIFQKIDEVKINWGSSTQKRNILKHFYPEIVVTSTAEKALRELALTVKDPYVLNCFIDKEYESVEDLLLGRHEDFLLAEGLLIKQGSLNINFNSNAQLLSLFKVWYPGLTSVGVSALKRLKNPVIDVYKKYTKQSKLVSSFGRKMYSYIEGDGRIHAGFTQLVPTGSRMSSSKPNMQQAPSTEQYRRMFVPTVGWKLVDSDYSSAEMLISAELSQDKGLLHAIEKGYDIHSYSAYLIFGQRWLDAGGSAEPIGKPPTTEANRLRGMVKGLSFSFKFLESIGLSSRKSKHLP